EVIGTTEPELASEDEEGEWIDPALRYHLMPLVANAGVHLLGVHNHGTQAATWRVLQSADAPALTLDDEVTLQVPQGQQLGLWAIDAQGGEYLELSFGEDNAEGNYFWLYDASGRLVFDGNPAKGYYYDAN